VRIAPRGSIPGFVCGTTFPFIFEPGADRTALGFVFENAEPKGDPTITVDDARS
jgi:hypothetical protein